MQTTEAADPVAAALAACSAAILQHAAAALGTGDKAGSDRAFALRGHVERLAEQWRDGVALSGPRGPRAKAEG